MNYTFCCSYCLKALKKYDIILDKEEIETQEIQENLADWLKVVIYYTLRLKIAPLIETIILLDRILFIVETGMLNVSLDEIDIIYLF